jgi:hypothetical protein
MNIQQQSILRFLENHPDSWFRPGNDLRLLACLFLAIRGRVIATEDEIGFRFRCVQPIRISA